MKKIAVSMFLLSILMSAQAQRKCGIETQALMQEVQQAKKGRIEMPRMLKEQYSISADGQTVRMIAKVGARFDEQVLRQRGITVGSQVGNIVTLTVPLTQIDALEQYDQVLVYNTAHTMAPTCDATRFDTRTDSVQDGLGLPQQFRGDSVLIGITDWGFDYTHVNYNNKSTTNHRLVRAWDQFKLSGPAPEGFNYGTEHIGREALLEAECDTFGLYGYHSHGTHVAGIAAGRGVNGKYVGQAPNASLLFASFLLDEASWLDAVAWMKQVAEEEQKRLVVNSSWGMYTFSTLDGTSLLSQAIDAYSNQGIVFVTSGGNNGDADFHISRTFTPDTVDTLRTVCAYYGAGVGQALIIWGEPGHDFSAGFAIEKDGVLTRSAMYSTAAGDSYANGTLIAGADTVAFDVMVEHANILNDRPHILLNVAKVGNDLLHLFITADDGTVHAWNVCNVENHAGNVGCAFGDNRRAGYSNGDRRHGVGEPACSNKAIAVAAHVADRVRYIDSLYIPGAIASFSSHGPLITGVHKPEISAPGNNVVSSISAFTTESYQAVASSEYGEHRYIWSKMSGTSMSSPAVTGIVALMLQANPKLTTDEVREILFTTARNDSQTGPLHLNDSVDDRWGYGKADALRAVNEALSRVSIASVDASKMPLVAYPNPATRHITVLTGSDMPQTMTIYATDGRRLLQQRVGKEAHIDVGNWNKGVYIINVDGRNTKIVVH